MQRIFDAKNKSMPILRDMETQQQSNTPGKAWSGNEYFDSKDRKWKKSKDRKAFSRRKILLVLLIFISVISASVYAYKKLSSSHCRPSAIMGHKRGQ